MSLSVFIDVTS